MFPSAILAIFTFLLIILSVTVKCSGDMILSGAMILIITAIEFIPDAILTPMELIKMDLIFIGISQLDLVMVPHP